MYGLSCSLPSLYSSWCNKLYRMTRHKKTQATTTTPLCTSLSLADMIILMFNWLPEGWVQKSAEVCTYSITLVNKTSVHLFFLQDPTIMPIIQLQVQCPPEVTTKKSQVSERSITGYSSWVPSSCEVWCLSHCKCPRILWQFWRGTGQSWRVQQGPLSTLTRSAFSLSPPWQSLFFPFSTLTNCFYPLSTLTRSVFFILSIPTRSVFPPLHLDMVCFFPLLPRQGLFFPLSTQTRSVFSPLSTPTWSVLPLSTLTRSVFFFSPPWQGLFFSLSPPQQGLFFSSLHPEKVCVFSSLHPDKVCFFFLFSPTWPGSHLNLLSPVKDSDLFQSKSEKVCTYSHPLVGDDLLDVQSLVWVCAQQSTYQVFGCKHNVHLLLTDGACQSAWLFAFLISSKRKASSNTVICFLYF